MKKSMIALFIIGLAISSNFIHAQETQEPPQLADSLVWKITGTGISEPSYLAGTIHLICEKDFIINQHMADAIEKSKQVYLELDMDDQGEMSKILTGMVSDKSLKERLSSVHYEQLSELIEKHTSYNITLFDKTKIFGISSMLTMAAMECPIKTVDVELMNLAQKSQLPIYGLETVEDQLKVFELMTPEISEVPWTDEEMAAYGLLPELMDELVKTYLSEDVSGMYDMTREMMLEADNGAVMLNALLDDRNTKWVEKMPAIAKESPTFFAVGAGHLGGEKGVINLLRQAGYTVEPVKH